MKGSGKEVGRLLNRAHEIRLMADYTGDSVEPVDAMAMVEQAEIFVATMRATFMPDDSDVIKWGPAP